MDQVGGEQAVDQVELAPEEVTAGIQAGYNKVAHPELEAEPEPEPTVETPPAETVDSSQLKDLMAQVQRIPELEKGLRDAGGRYGALKQSLEQLQQSIAAAKTPKEEAANTEEAGELLAEMQEEFPEIAGMLKNAFAKVMAKGKPMDESSIEQIVAKKRAEEREIASTEAFKLVTEAHPDWVATRETPEFKAWRDTLSAREQARLARTEDPFVVIEAFDKYAEHQKSKAKPPTPAAKPGPSARLVKAVLPVTHGQSKPNPGEPSAKESIRAGYERVAGKRR